MYFGHIQHFFGMLAVTYFVVGSIHPLALKSVTPHDIYSTRLLRISQMFNASRRCTNPPHPAYTISLNSIFRAKQRSLGTQIRPPHSETTRSLPTVRYCRQIDEQGYGLYSLVA